MAIYPSATPVAAAAPLRSRPVQWNMGILIIDWRSSIESQGTMSRSVTKWHIPSRKLLACVALAASMIAATGCHRAPSLDSKLLAASGLSYEAIVQMKALKVTNAEIVEITKAREGGVSEPTCVEVVHIFHQRGEAFTAGDMVANMVGAGMKESNTIELARMNQLGATGGELQAMRLAGLSDDIVLEVAHQRMNGTSVLSGASLAGMKNVGVRNSTLLELVRRGIPDSQASAIISSRRHGASDADLLRRFSGS
jgi:hypothetical protein